MPRLCRKIPVRTAEQVRSLWFAKSGTPLTINRQLVMRSGRNWKRQAKAFAPIKRLNASFLQIDGAYHGGRLPSWHIGLGSSLQRPTPVLPRMTGAYAELERAKGHSMTSLQRRVRRVALFRESGTEGQVTDAPWWLFRNLERRIYVRRNGKVRNELSLALPLEAQRISWQSFSPQWKYFGAILSFSAGFILWRGRGFSVFGTAVQLMTRSCPVTSRQFHGPRKELIISERRFRDPSRAQVASCQKRLQSSDTNCASLRISQNL